MISPSYTVAETTLVGPFENEETQAVLRIISDPEESNFEDRGELVAILVDFLSANFPARALQDAIDILADQFEKLRADSDIYDGLLNKAAQVDEIGAVLVDQEVVAMENDEFVTLDDSFQVYECQTIALREIIAGNDDALNRELREASA